MGRWHLRIVPITVLWPSQQEDSHTSSTKPGASLPLAVATGTQTCIPLGTRSPVSPHGEWVTAAGTQSHVPRRNQLWGSAVARLTSTRWHQCSSAMPTGMPRRDANPAPVSMARRQPHPQATARCQPCHHVRERRQPCQGCRSRHRSVLVPGCPLAASSAVPQSRPRALSVLHSLIPPNPKTGRKRGKVLSWTTDLRYIPTSTPLQNAAKP